MTDCFLCGRQPPRIQGGSTHGQLTSCLSPTYTHEIIHINLMQIAETLHLTEQIAQNFWDQEWCGLFQVNVGKKSFFMFFVFL